MMADYVHPFEWAKGKPGKVHVLSPVIAKELEKIIGARYLGMCSVELVKGGRFETFYILEVDDLFPALNIVNYRNMQHLDY